MSLESNLELNNKLVAEQNTLLTQLLAAMTSGKTFTADTPHQPKTEGSTVGKVGTGGTKPRKGPFYWKHTESDSFGLEDTEEGLRSMCDADPLCVEITKVEYLQLQEEASKTTFKPVTLESQPLPVAVALAILFGEEGRTFNEAMITEAVAITETATGKERNEQIDALTMALKGVPRATKMHGEGVFDLSLHMVEHWDDLPGIVERRAFAELLLDTPHAERADVKPEVKEATLDGDPKALFAQAEQLILTLAKGGYRSEAVKILTEYGAKKLSEVKPDDIPAVIAAAEKALEG